MDVDVYVDLYGDIVAVAVAVVCPVRSPRTNERRQHRHDPLDQLGWCLQPCGETSFIAPITSRMAAHSSADPRAIV